MSRPPSGTHTRKAAAEHDQAYAAASPYLNAFNNTTRTHSRPASGTAASRASSAATRREQVPATGHAVADTHSDKLLLEQISRLKEQCTQLGE